MSKAYYKANDQASDMLEIITAEKANVYKDLKKAGQDLKSLPKTTLVLDFHGVIDLFEPHEILCDKSITCVSFVGRSSATRANTREDIQARIKSGQISQGVLVFTRPKGERGEEIRPRHLGTKAWVIGYITDPSEKSMFMDDSQDHIDIVNLSNFSHVTAHMITGGKKQISKLLNLH